MSTPLAIAMFLTIWWVVIFTVLPFGIRSQHETGEIVPGTDPGAPVRTRLGRIALITTLISIAIWLPLYIGISQGWLGFEGFPFNLF